MDCPVCFNDLCSETTATTPCGHKFCKNCLDTVIQSDIPNCPMCRHVLREVKVVKFRSLYEVEEEQRLREEQERQERLEYQRKQQKEYRQKKKEEKAKKEAQLLKESRERTLALLTQRQNEMLAQN